MSETVQFETALKSLESTVKSLEKGDLPLDEALGHFERGVTLVKQCHETLSAAQQKVNMLTESGLQPFLTTEESSSDDV